ncbi:ketoacyl-ACP synthase III family protein [Tsukamurella ocularis]|uniref:ketoacyl-ACP synthase III family protein n=1 Tax=Tsukamurella ocularis TaxID=1970234 RepID=UPI0021688C0E|nr:ketoacyl-ACP synthase III family protein [Tsukamurella ocularis]MCS3779337.1 3-oxoacyl-[acyl-carrier-protein] synthase-3 [Tsukamurella ocularis]MCS3789937.1 3-oxoacyl-[acyl-carrier-protein] synthase-3 [Tsukamurella ocularis]MCS3852434.1 3-oxoacyl-[acyl-carrier-protein] synthase-3 [Tsukamurella ocularis]
MQQICVVGSAVHLPAGTETVDHAIEQKMITRTEAGGLGVERVHIAGKEENAPNLAVRAVKESLRSAAVEPRSVSFFGYGHTYYQGHDFWSPAHYVARQTDMLNATPVSINQMCNGGAAGLSIASSHLRATQDKGAAVVATSDVFKSPGFNRWSGDYDTAYGDGATATVLANFTPSAPHLQLLACQSTSSSRFEAMYRGEDQFMAVPHERRKAIDIKATKRAFFRAEGGAAAFREEATLAISRLFIRALGQARVRCDELSYVLLPRLSPKVLDLMYAPLLDGTEAICLRSDTGHLGAGDFLANLDYAVHDDSLKVGGTVAVIGGGGGFTWTAAVFRKAEGRSRDLVKRT